MLIHGLSLGPKFLALALRVLGLGLVHHGFGLVVVLGLGLFDLQSLRFFLTVFISLVSSFKSIV